MPYKKTYIVATLFLVIASFAHFWNLEISPAWYTDEGTHIEIARHLMQAKIHYLGIIDSFVIVARLPVFEHLLAL